MALILGQVLAIIWICINTLILGPYVSYQILEFYKHKTYPFIFNRKPSMVISFCISALVTIIFIMPLCYGFEIFTQKSEGTQHYGYIIILYSITTTFTIGFWRAWHVWFDAKYKMEAATNTWAKHLNHSESDTFRKYKDTLGNSNWTKKCLLFIAILLISISALVIFWKHFVVIEGIVCFTLFLTFIGLVFMIRRLSSVKDEIMLRTEYIYFAYFGCFYGVCYVTLYAISHDWKEADPTNIEVLYDALYLIIPSPILYCLILIQTQWVLYQYKLRELEQNRSMIDTGSQDMSVIDANLKDILADFEGFRCFMEYLVKCLSAENLLYVSEVIQFLRDLTEKYGITASTVQLRSYLEQFPIPNILPTSYIMSQIDATSIRFLRLCEKYILVQSEFEINISHRNRKNIERVYKVLEDKINEMNPKISKLSNIFGSDSQFRASRRASQTKYDDYEDEDDSYRQPYNKRKGHHVPQSSCNNKVLHGCLEDIQLLSNTDDMVQKMFDALCSTLGDVFSNLNDAGGRFRQTDVYCRWLDTHFKKNQLCVEERAVDDDTSNDTEQETKPMKTKAADY
eukprot:724402_1